MDKLVFETTADKHEAISAFAFNTGKMIEQLIWQATSNLHEKNNLLEGKILRYYTMLEGEAKEKYKEYFDIRSGKEGLEV